MVVRYIFLILGFTKIINGKQEGFIVGGHKAGNIKDFAYCAALFIDDGVHCGSSVLNQDILITAAHCLETAHTLTATVGSLNRNEGTKKRVKKYIIHRHYSETTIQNDIGLCKLKTPLQLGQNVKRVLLLRTPPFDEEGVVAGWGLIDEYKDIDTVRLKHTNQKLWSYKTCKTVLERTLPRGTICGGERLSKRDFASAGDSGGALVVRGSIQVGLVSFKVTQISRSLVVYTDVSYFYDWIMKSSNKLSCKQTM